MFRRSKRLVKKRIFIFIAIIVVFTIIHIKYNHESYLLTESVPTTFKVELSKSTTTFQVPNEIEAKIDSVLDSENTALTLRYWDLTNSLSRGAITSVIFTKLDVFPNLWGTEHSQHLKQNDDRILPQLVLGMEANVSLFGEEQNKIKTILLPDSFDWWGKTGWNNTHILQEEDCPGLQQKCVFSDNPDLDLIFDALIIVRDNAHEKAFSVSPHILKFHFILEPPIISSAKLTGRRDLLASFYRGSDVTTPYGKWVYFDPTVKFKTQEKDYAAGKTKMAAVFISNCRTYNGRLRFIEKLQKFIDVDIYGNCGYLTCPRRNQTECFEMLKRDYRFYLSFENSNCRDYITEKLFLNAYENNVIPIVLGANPDDYKAICPENSYIHVEDFQDPEELANYMKQLADNHTAYNSYFRWKDTGQFINTNFFCRVCTMVHFADKVPPPKRTSAFKWNKYAAVSTRFCLPFRVWYWRSVSANDSQISIAAVLVLILIIFCLVFGLACIFLTTT